MIKKLQLRGISRNPSDRMTSDGGCDESINVHIDSQETAPTPAPANISSSVYGSQQRTPIVFIHKVSSATIYVGYSQNSGIRFYAYSGGNAVPIVGNPTNIPQSEDLVSVTSIGNTLIAFTSEKVYYFLYKEGQYTFLGNEIPVPKIEVVSTEAELAYATGITIASSDLKPENTDLMVLNWNQAKDESSPDHPALLETIANIWDAITLRNDEFRNDGKFLAPFFLRYAVRLYNGDYIHLSAPILCGGQTEEWMSALTTTYPNRTITASLHTFSVFIRGDYEIGNWGDVVKSIDFFASSPIYTPNMNAGFAKMYKRFVEGSATDNGIIVFNKMDENKDEFVREEVLSKGQFYQIKSISLDNAIDMAELGGGTMTIKNSGAVSGDELLVKDRLPDGYRDANQYLPTMASHAYNSRTVLAGAKEILGRGNVCVNGLQAFGIKDRETEQGLFWPKRFALRYKLVDPDSGAVAYVLGSESEGEVLAGYLINRDSLSSPTELEYGSNPPEAGDYFQMAQPYAWIAYPDTRCTEVELTVWPYGGASPTTYSIPLSEHPLLECAYAFVGFGNVVYNGASVIARQTTENRVINQRNKIFQSEFENPWLFPLEGRLTFNDEVIDTAMTSVPLSEGQLGQFAVYVFTKGGIRVLATASDGLFLLNNASPEIGRHIALPGTILPLEQAVVFVTKRGAMILQGHQVTEISRGMMGLPFILDDDLFTALTTTSQAPLIPLPILQSAMDGDTLMGFLSEAKLAYDNNGGRILFIRNSGAYYEYRLESQTWHKGFCDALAQNTLFVLNSYPNCLVSSGNLLDSYSVMDFTTFLDDATLLEDTAANEVPALIVTRPFDLDSPDVRKVVKDIRIRGAFNRENVRYLLLGSFDGLDTLTSRHRTHWRILPSLRDGSYKLFRLVIIAKLSPMERISWIDIDFETRLNNKLR